MYSINDLPDIILGSRYDNRVRTVAIDCSEWLSKYPRLASFRVEVSPPGGRTAYVAQTALQGGVLTWDVTSKDTAVAGSDGRYQVVATGADGSRKTSACRSFVVMPILEGVKVDNDATTVQAICGTAMVGQVKCGEV